MIRHRWVTREEAPPLPAGGYRPQQCAHCGIWRCKVRREPVSAPLRVSRVIVVAYLICHPKAPRLVQETGSRIGRLGWAETKSSLSPTCSAGWAMEDSVIFVRPREIDP